MRNHVSIVIPVYNDRENLKKCIGSLRQAADRGCEIIIVDDASTDNPEAAIKDFPCKFIKLPANRRQAHARNRGVREARGDIILFIDSDCVAMTDWAGHLSKELVRSHEGSGDIAAVCGRMDSDGGFFETCYAYAIYAYVQGGPRRFMNYLNTACVAIYKDAFYKVGGFSEDMAVSEDPDLALKLVENGYRIVFEPSVSIFHNHGINTFKDFMLKQKRMGYELGLRLALKHKARFWWLLPFLLNPVTHFLSIVPLAFLTTLKIVAHNIRRDKKLLMYAFFIFLGKVVYRWGIFLKYLEEKDLIRS